MRAIELFEVLRAFVSRIYYLLVTFEIDWLDKVVEKRISCQLCDVLFHFFVWWMLSLVERNVAQMSISDSVIWVNHSSKLIVWEYSDKGKVVVLRLNKIRFWLKEVKSDRTSIRVLVVTESENRISGGKWGIETISFWIVKLWILSKTMRITLCKHKYFQRSVVAL